MLFSLYKNAVVNEMMYSDGMIKLAEKINKLDDSIAKNTKCNFNEKMISQNKYRASFINVFSDDTEIAF